MNTNELTTYQAVVLQSRAHRAIKNQLTALLKHYGMTMMQWSIVGMISDAGKKGMRISDLAHALDTSLAFVTTSVNVLQAKGFVERSSHKHDNRAKLVHLNPVFSPKVIEIETRLKESQQESLYSDIRAEDMAGYVSVLHHFAKTVS